MPSANPSEVEAETDMQVIMEKPYSSPASGFDEKSGDGFFCYLPEAPVPITL